MSRIPWTLCVILAYLIKHASVKNNGQKSATGWKWQNCISYKRGNFNCSLSSIFLSSWNKCIHWDEFLLWICWDWKCCREIHTYSCNCTAKLPIISDDSWCPNGKAIFSDMWERWGITLKSSAAQLEKKMDICVVHMQWLYWPSSQWRHKVETQR